MTVTRLLVVAAVVLVVVAAADAVRNREAPTPAAPVAAARLVVAVPTGFALDRGAVRWRGRPYLARGDLSRAFPGGARGRVGAERLAEAEDGTIVVGVRDDAGRSALELWRGRRLLSAFRVPVGAYAGGLALGSDGAPVAAFGADGRPKLYAPG